MANRISRRNFLAQSVAGALSVHWLAGCSRDTSTTAGFDEFLDHDATDLAYLLKTKEISQLELVEVVIRRIEAMNPSLNFMTNRFYDRARGMAGNISLDTPFAGVPLLLKDMIDVGGMPRTDGSNFPPNNVPKNNAMYVDGLERAGFNFLGMTNVRNTRVLPVPTMTGLAQH